MNITFIHTSKETGEYIFYSFLKISVTRFIYYKFHACVIETPITKIKYNMIDLRKQQPMNDKVDPVLIKWLLVCYITLDVRKYSVFLNFLNCILMTKPLIPLIKKKNKFCVHWISYLFAAYVTFAYSSYYC